MKEQHQTKRKFAPFRWLRNWIWDVQFNIQEMKLREKVESEIEHAETLSKHGSMDGFRIYKEYMQEYEERKRKHNLRKLQ